MPRVASMKRKYVVRDFVKWLSGEMYERNLRQKDMGDILNISQQAFSARMKNGLFTCEEMALIFHEFDTPIEKIGQLLKY